MVVEGTKVVLFDMMGRSIPIDIDHEGRSYYLNLNQLKTGSYIIKVINSKGTITKRLIKI